MLNACCVNIQQCHFHSCNVPFIADSEYSTDELDEACDVVPEMRRRSLKNQRCVGTTNILHNPIRKAVDRSIESSSTENGSIPTAQMYFAKKQSQTLPKLTRHSTELPLPQQGTGMPLPNISSITLHEKTLTTNTTSMESTDVADSSIYSTTMTTESSTLPSRVVEGKSESLPHHSESPPHHSTPTDEPDNETNYNPVFNATGHSNCASGHKEGCNLTAPNCPTGTLRSKTGTLRSRAQSMRSACSTERFCDCESVLRCGCTTLASSMAFPNPDDLKYLGSL